MKKGTSDLSSARVVALVSMRPRFVSRQPTDYREDDERSDLAGTKLPTTKRRQRCWLLRDDQQVCEIRFELPPPLPFP
jgi:hypothetical protein